MPKTKKSSKTVVTLLGWIPTEVLRPKVHERILALYVDEEGYEEIRTGCLSFDGGFVGGKDLRDFYFHLGDDWKQIPVEQVILWVYESSILEELQKSSKSKKKS